MPTAINGLPPPHEKLVNTESGLTTDVWYRFFSDSTSTTSDANSAFPFIDARDFGVSGEGTDQTQAMQDVWDHAFNSTSTFGGATIVLPAGNIVIDPDEVVWDGNGTKCISVVGQGPNATNIVVSANGSVGLNISSCAHARFADFGMKINSEATTLNLLFAEDHFQSLFENIKLENGFGNAKFASNVALMVRNLFCNTGDFFSEGTFKTNSYNVAIQGGFGPAIFDSCHLMSNNKVDRGMMIFGVDILKVTNSHFYHAYNSYIHLTPINANVQAVQITGNTFDNDTPPANALIHVQTGTANTFATISIKHNYFRVDDAVTPAILYNASDCDDIDESDNQFLGGVLPRTITAVGDRFRINGALYGSATYDPASLADGAGATTTVTVTGAALGDYATASFSLTLADITLTAWVSATDTVSVRFQNESGGVVDLSSGTLRVFVYPKP